MVNENGFAGNRMNFVLDMDIRSLASPPMAEAALASPAPTPGGRAFAENFQALSLSAEDPLSVSQDAASLFLPDFASLAPQSVNAQPADSFVTGIDAPLPYPSLSAAPEADVENSEAAVPGPVLLPVADETAPAGPVHGPEVAEADARSNVSVPLVQPDALPSSENLLVQAANSDPLIRKALLIREPQPVLERAAPVDGQPPEPAPAPTASPAPVTAANDLALLQAEPAAAASTGAIAAATEQARSDTQLPQPAPAAALSIASAPAQIMAPAPAAPAMPIAQAVLIALPSELPDIVTRGIQDTPGERITVQLDPPELGRVSIDFRFDGQALQHVTITAETPEAVRQLRLMHGELLEALEQNGLGQQDMTFQQQTPQERQDQAFAERAQSRPGSLLVSPQPAILSLPSRPSLEPGRLDIRL